MKLHGRADLVTGRGRLRQLDSNQMAKGAMLEGIRRSGAERRLIGDNA